MSMTREDAIEELERLLSHWDDLENGKRSFRWYSKDAVEVALSALRPVIREQVEKVWRAHWNESVHLGGFVYCSRCGYNALEANNYTFCPKCGSPFTDEAVEMVMRRLEAMYGEAKAD